MMPLTAWLWTTTESWWNHNTHIKHQPRHLKNEIFSQGIESCFLSSKISCVSISLSNSIGIAPNALQDTITLWA
jgi:hypothetical protein